MNRAKTSGIGGIERKIQAQQEETDRNISDAFADLKVLMTKAKDMSTLSKNIASKIKDKGNRDISDDEVSRGATRVCAVCALSLADYARLRSRTLTQFLVVYV